MDATNKQTIRELVQGLYDFQELRIGLGNRICATTGASTKDVITEYRKLTSRNNLENNRYVKTPTLYTMCHQYVTLCESEQEMTNALSKEVVKHPLWDAFFKDIRGCGTVMAGVCIAYLDPYKARHCSSFWKYAGLDVVDGEGRGRKHTEMREYTDSEGNTKEKRSLTYNPFLKSKLLGVLAASFLRTRDSPYGKIYYDYKSRLEQRDPDLSKGHRHRMAMRYAVKMFLRDLWVEWRTLEGLPVTEPYEVAYLGKTPHHQEASPT